MGWDAVVTTRHLATPGYRRTVCRHGNLRALSRRTEKDANFGQSALHRGWSTRPGDTLAI